MQQVPGCILKRPTRSIMLSGLRSRLTIVLATSCIIMSIESPLSLSLTHAHTHTQTHRHVVSTPPAPALTPSLMAHLHTHHTSLGYRFLTYLVDTKPHRLSPYKDLATKINKNNYMAVLINDIKVLSIV